MHFLFFLLLFTLSNYISCQEVFVAKKKNTYVCVTNSNFALTWITNSNESHVSHYIPEPQNNSFDCKISSKAGTFLKKPWYLTAYFNREVILDRRWEGFNISSTTVNPKNPSSQLIKKYKIRYDDFYLPFSVKNKHSAIVFLCDDVEFRWSNCSWFSLKGFKGKETNLKKCSGTNNHTETSCEFLLTGKTSPELHESEDVWSHFKIVKNEQGIAVQEIGGLKNETVLEIPSDDKIKNIYLGTTKDQIFWKFHTVDYIFTKNASTNVQLGPPIEVKGDFVCISMFVMMCSVCRLKLNLSSDENLIREEIFKPENKRDWQWFEIKFVADIPRQIRSKKMHLFVSTFVTEQNKTMPYWAIDEVRLCQKNEFRMISLTQPANCQLIGENSQTLSFTNPKEQIRGSATNCPENSIGSFCVPCELLFDDCDMIKVCSETCWCSAGFKGLPDCKNMCHSKMYGHGCTRYCGHCHTSADCNVRNGTCSKCSENYVGPKCHTLHVGDIKILPISWDQNQMIITWKYLGSEQSKLQQFEISVTASDDGSVGERKIFSSSLKADQKQVTVNKLLPSTTYTVRIWAINQYSNKMTSVSETSPPEPPLLRSKKCFGSSYIITLELSPQTNKSYDVTVLVSDNSGNLYDHSELKIVQELGVNLSRYRTVHKLTKFDGSYPIVVGDGGATSRNFPLAKNTSYNFTFILAATYKDKTSYSVEFLSCSTTAAFDFSYLVWSPLLLLVLVAILTLVFIWWKKSQARRPTNNKKNEATETQNQDLIELVPRNSSPRMNTGQFKNTESYLDPIFPSLVISAKYFRTYVEEAEKNQDLERQFQIIDNTKKIYDEVPGNSFFHYVDMAYLNGATISKAYLLTDVPKNDTMGTFWKWIYEANVKHMVLVGEQNYEEYPRYWPQQGEKLNFGRISIEMVSEHCFSSYTYNTLLLRNRHEQRQIDQMIFSYTGSEVKKYVPFFKRLLKHSLSSHSPILIHSSDSMKRIGFVLLCDMSLRMVKEEGQVDVLRISKQVMDQVAGVVDNLQLYKLSHLVISEFIYEDELASNLVKNLGKLKNSTRSNVANQRRLAS